MNIHRRRSGSSRTLTLMIVALAGGHLIVPYVLSHVTLSAAIVSGLVAVVVAKHVGLAAVLFRPVLNSAAPPVLDSGFIDRYATPRPLSSAEAVFSVAASAMVHGIGPPAQASKCLQRRCLPE